MDDAGVLRSLISVFNFILIRTMEGPFMIIANSDIHLASLRKSIEKHEVKESLVAWKQGQGRIEETAQGAGGKGKKLEILAHKFEQEASKVSFSAEVHRNRPVRVESVPVKPENEVAASLNLSVLKAMVEKLTGKKIKLLDPAELKAADAEVNNVAGSKPNGETIPVEEDQGWGLVYDYYESHYEYESSSFSAKGIIRTADGHEIEIGVELNMSREFMTREEIHVRAGDALKDPLVINFEGTAAELTQTKFAFDIDVDGREDQVSFVKPGSGLLTLDKNGDGRVNDGSELFGTLTGNGFAELAAYDEDGNGWIDEADMVYDRLRIWTKDENGRDQLFALGQKDIGAIYLGNVSTPFALKDPQNQLLGQVRSTGIFLRENGGAGTVQQLDFVV